MNDSNGRIILWGLAYNGFNGRYRPVWNIRQDARGEVLFDQDWDLQYRSRKFAETKGRNF